MFIKNIPININMFSNLAKVILKRQFNRVKNHSNKNAILKLTST